MRFHLYPLSRAFSNRCVFDENAQRFSVDRRPKRIEMYVFSNENALVWTGSKRVLTYQRECENKTFIHFRYISKYTRLTLKR